MIAAVSLFGSFLVDVSRAQASLGIAVENQISTLGIRVNIPQVFVGGKFIGGCDVVRELHARGELAPLVRAAKQA